MIKHPGCGLHGAALIDRQTNRGAIANDRLEALDLAEMCAPNGTIVIKEISSRTGVKRSFATAQEFFATKVFRYTQGSDIDWIDMQELAQMYRKAGFEVTVRMIDRWYPHPHQLLVARRGTSLQ